MSNPDARPARPSAVESQPGREQDPLAPHLSTSFNARVRALKGDSAYFDLSQDLSATVNVAPLPSSPLLIYHIVQSDWNERRKAVTDSVAQWGRKAAKTTLALFEQHSKETSDTLLLKSVFQAWGVGVVTDAVSYPGQLGDVAHAFETSFFKAYGGESPEKSMQRLGKDLVTGMIQLHGFNPSTLAGLSREDAQHIAHSVRRCEDLLEGWLGRYLQSNDDLQRFRLCIEADVMSVLRRVYEKPVAVDTLHPEEMPLFEALAMLMPASVSDIPTTPHPAVPLADSRPEIITTSSDQAVGQEAVRGLSQEVQEYLGFRQRFLALIRTVRTQEAQPGNGRGKVSIEEVETAMIQRLGLRANGLGADIQTTLGTALVAVKDQRSDAYNEAIRLLWQLRHPGSDEDFARLNHEALTQIRERFANDLMDTGISLEPIFGDLSLREMTLPLERAIVENLAESMRLLVGQLGLNREGQSYAIDPARVVNFLRSDVSLADQIFHLYNLLPIHETAQVVSEQQDREHRLQMHHQAIEEYMAIRSNIFALMYEFKSLDGSGTQQFAEHVTQLASSLNIDENVLVNYVNQLQDASRSERIRLLDTFLEHTNFQYRSHVIATGGYDANFISGAHKEIRTQWGALAQQWGIFESYGIQDPALEHIDMEILRGILAAMGAREFLQASYDTTIQRIFRMPTTEDQLYALMHIDAFVETGGAVSQRRGGGQESQSSAEWDSIDEMTPPPAIAQRRDPGHQGENWLN